MLIVAIIILVPAAFVAGILVHAALRGRASGETLTEELRFLGFDAFFGFLTSRLGGAIARRLSGARQSA